MPFPNFPEKHAQDAFIGPQDTLADYRRRGLMPARAPESVILTYQRRLLDRILAEEQTEPLGPGFGGVYLLSRTDGAVAVVGEFGIGAPAATTLMEILIAHGARRFLSIGAAGGLQPALRVGDIIVCDRAIRDEGVSYHYLPPEKYAQATPALTTAFAAALSDADVPHTTGTTWTIDTPFRETVAEVRHYQSEGVLTVEMEASAVFSVARHRGVEVASGFVVSDLLTGEVWDSQFDAEPVSAGLWTLYQAACAALTSGSG